MYIIHDQEYYERRIPQPDLGLVGNFKRFVWNKEKRKFLDKTLKEWAEITLFYLCFFGVLIAIFAIQIWIVIDYVTSRKEPYYLRSKLLPVNKTHLLE